MSALRKVLVVDDDPVVAKSFNRVLTDYIRRSRERYPTTRRIVQRDVSKT